MANLTLARRDSYLDYLKAGVKQDTLTALRNAPLHIQEEMSRSEERRSSGSTHQKHGCFHPYAFMDRMSGVPAWKKIRDRQQGKKGLNLTAEAG